MNISLFDIEFFFQYIWENIKKPSTLKYRVSLVSGFLKILLTDVNQSKYYSYYLLLHPVIVKNFLLVKNEFFSPPLLDELITITEKFYDIELFKENYLERKEILGILNAKKAEVLSFLNGNIETADKRDSDFSREVSSLNIVLVENLPENFPSNLGTDNTFFYCGEIFKLYLSSSNRPANEKIDKIDFNNLINLKEAEIVKHLNHIVKIAKNHHLMSKNNQKYFNFTFYFKEKDYIYSGSSLGIGAVCLSYNSILINTLRNYYYKFFEDVVFSAEIDENGNLLKLNSEVIKQKLKTVFYSRYRKFVIPEENIIDVNEELVKLNSLYPNRQLKIIPLRNFQDVFKNLDIIEKCKLSVPRKIKANYKRYYLPVNISLSFLALFVLAFFVFNYLIPRIDKNPVSMKFVYDKFQAVNKYDIPVFERKYIPVDTSLKLSKFIIESKYIIKDVDADNVNEIIMTGDIGDFDTNRRTVFCFNSDNTIKWEYKFPPQKVYFNNTDFGKDEPEPDFLGTHHLLKVNDDKGFIVSGALNHYFAYFLYLMDYQGNPKSVFWSAGHLSTANSVFDVDLDGKEEILFGGTSNKNEFRGAVIVIFDQDFISGSTPMTDPLKDGKPGLEKYFIVFPRSILKKWAMTNQNMVIQIKNNNSGNFHVVVLEYEDIGKLSGNSPFLLFHFDKDLNLFKVGSSSSFDNQIEIRKNNGELPANFDLNAHLDSLKKSVLYWDGDKFVNYPAINKYYIEARNSLKKP